MGSVNRLLCIGIGVVWLANVMHMSGMATPHWAETEQYRVDTYDDEGNPESLKATGETGYLGLFEECEEKNLLDDDCSDLWFQRISMKEQVLQVLAYLALVVGILGIAAAIILQLILVFSDTAISRCTFIVIISVVTLSCICSFGFILSALCLFGNRRLKVGSTVGYSFFLCLVSAILYLVGLGLIVRASKDVQTCKGHVKGQGHAQEPAGNGEEDKTHSSSMLIETEDGATTQFRVVN